MLDRVAAFSMPDSHYHVGETFPIQFAWRLPEGGYLRAIFQAEVLALVDPADKYIIRLNQLLAGREETADGETKAKALLSADYWQLVGQLVGRIITVAYEAADGRALYMRLETLTGEHNFFSRFTN
jgi:hypothetical protein